MDLNWLQAALSAIRCGVASKLIKDNITISRVGDKIIRIDIKEG